MSDEGTWVLTFHDGSTERQDGRLTINDGVVWITQRGTYGSYVQSQIAYPLIALRKWERERS